MPKVSVVIPFYFGARWLGEAIESVLRQTYADFEVILVNDGSPENIAGILDKFNGKIRYFFKENGGPGSARNLGMREAIGEFIAFLDSDDLWESQKLERQVAEMETTGAAWSHTGYALFKDGEDPCAGRMVAVASCQGDVFKRCLLSAPIATPCVMLRTRILSEWPGLKFSARMRFGQDSLFWINLALRYPLAVIPDVLARVRIRGGNAAKRARVQLQAKAQIWEEFLSGVQNREGKRIDGLIGSMYRYCHLANRLVGKIERTGRMKTDTIEFLSRFLYVGPFVLLKVRHFLSVWYR